ncbi:M23 family metallopeptidase, partial [Mesorhizobium japonicum]|uniref:M23 family metallopeptidase n=1 Tax=Mesorhizobium japonicum TaxID=2066070 RepID=UPI003B5CB40E
TDGAYATASARAGSQLLGGVDETPAPQAIARDGYTATKLSAPARLLAGFSWSGPVRWPFPYPVTTSSGFGGRAAPCSGCSTNHRGLDMTPGNGAQIFSIAAGRVVEAEYDWSFGNHVVIEHVVDGRTVRSLYAHMQTGSTRVRVGQQVDVGQPVGLVGATGQVTGPHLH